MTGAADAWGRAVRSYLKAADSRFSCSLRRPSRGLEGLWGLWVWFDGMPVMRFGGDEPVYSTYCDCPVIGAIPLRTGPDSSVPAAAFLRDVSNGKAVVHAGRLVTELEIRMPRVPAGWKSAEEFELTLAASAPSAEAKDLFRR